MVPSVRQAGECMAGSSCQLRPRSYQRVTAEQRGMVVTAQSLTEERSEPLMADSELAQRRECEPVSGVVSVWPSYQRSIVRLLLLSYSGLSLVTLSCLHWQAVGQYGWRLTDFPTVSPGSSEWRSLLPAVVVVMGVVCCAPVALLLFLWQQHRSGRIAEAKQLQLELGADAQLSTLEQLVLQLTAMYRTQQWWMPAYVLVRRLLAAVLLVTIRSSSVWVWLTVAGFVQLIIHLRLHPYEHAVDNDFESLTLLSLSLQTALLAAYPPPFSSAVSSTLVGTTTALLVGPLLAIAAHVFLRAYRQHLRARLQPQQSEQDAL